MRHSESDIPLFHIPTLVSFVPEIYRCFSQYGDYNQCSSSCLGLFLLLLLLQYQVQKGDLQSRTLNLSVWHAEDVWRNVFLGEVEVSLGLWDWTYTQPVWQDLQPRVGGIKHPIE